MCVQNPHGFNVIDNIFVAWKTVNSMVQMTSQLEWLLRFIAASLTILILLIMATMPNRYHRGSAQCIHCQSLSGCEVSRSREIRIQRKSNYLIANRRRDVIFVIFERKVTYKKIVLHTLMNPLMNAHQVCDDHIHNHTLNSISYLMLE